MQKKKVQLLVLSLVALVAIVAGLLLLQRSVSPKSSQPLDNPPVIEDNSFPGPTIELLPSNP
jgi:hypothetical protein